MRKITTCLLTLMLSLPCLAWDKSARARNCDTQHTTETVTTGIFSVCNSDPEQDILITVISKLTVKRCEDEDGRVTFKAHFQFHGTGVGIRTGNEYVISSQSKSFEVVTQGCEFSVSSRHRQVLISKGPLPNERMLSTFTLTVNSDCEQEVTITSEAICQD